MFQQRVLTNKDQKVNKILIMQIIINIEHSLHHKHILKLIVIEIN
jgi:hypothetical protein